MQTKTKKKLELPRIKGYTFNKENHVHAFDGKPLTGVTTILSVIAKPMLIQWAANMAVDYLKERSLILKDVIAVDTEKEESIWKEARTAHRKKKEAAGEAGTDVHAQAELYIKNCIEKGGNAFRPDFALEKQLQNLVDWAVDNKVKFLASEKNLYSEKMWVGGICDIICEIDGKRYVGDIKTSSGIYSEHFIQTSAYAEMLKEMVEYKSFDGVIIINLKKDGTFDYQYNYDLEGNFNCFQAALTLYKHLNQLK